MRLLFRSATIKAIVGATPLKLFDLHQDYHHQSEEFYTFLYSLLNES